MLQMQMLGTVQMVNECRSEMRLQMRMRWVLNMVQSVGGWLVDSNSLSLSLWVFAPILTTLTHHRKVQNLNSYHFFDWLSGSINIEFCSVAKAQEKNTPQIHTPHNSRMSQWQWCSFWGQSLDWFGWAFGLSEAAYHAVWVLLHFV